MNHRHVRFTTTARRHVERERSWWFENRDYPGVFVAEFEQAIRVLAMMPSAGQLYEGAGIAGLRRIYVPKVACHLYYTFDDTAAVVRAFWPARRERGPRLRS